MKALLPILLLVVTTSAEKRTYWPTTVAQLASGKVLHTHVELTATVTLVKHEGDGDLHIRLQDEKCEDVRRYEDDFPVNGMAAIDLTNIGLKADSTDAEFEKANPVVYAACGYGKEFVVAECIPSLPCKQPRLHDHVKVRGIQREDYEHKWREVHPVEKLEILP